MYFKIPNTNRSVAVGSKSHTDYLESIKPKAKPKAKPKRRPKAKPESEE
jgi:hypothetical protein